MKDLVINLQKHFDLTRENSPKFNTIFDFLDVYGHQEVSDVLKLNLYYIGDKIEMEDENDTCRVICFPIGNGIGRYYTDSGRVFENTLNIETLTDDQRCEILTYNLGRNFDKDEIVNWRDLFMHSKFLKELPTYEEMLDRIKSYSQEDDDLSKIDFDSLDEEDVIYYFKKYLDNGNGQGHL